MINDRELVVIAKIQELTPIEGKDRIELAQVENYNVIVQKGEFNVGDLCVYVFYDVVLPEKPEFEFLRSRCWSKLYKGFRIKEMKMGTVFSSGIVFPLSILPPKVKIVEGADISEIIGAVKYDPESVKERGSSITRKDKTGPILKFFLKFKWFRFLFFQSKKIPGGYPTTVPKSNETNIQKNFDQLKNSGHTFTVTEKLEGQSFMACLDKPVWRFGKPEYKIYSHNVRRSVGDGSNWDQMSTKYELEEVLRCLYKKYKTMYAIEAEICGPGIQGNIYGLPEKCIFVFRVFNVETGRVLNLNQMQKFCKELRLEPVPVIDDNFDIDNYPTVSVLLEYSDGTSQLADVPREGVILTSTRDPFLRAKVKGEKYKTWFGKKFDTNE